MSIVYVFIILCGLAALAYGLVTARAVLACSTGNDRMRQIASAVQEGAAAYLNRQYTTISLPSFSSSSSAGQSRSAF